MIEGVTKTDELHHGYLIEGACGEALSRLRDFLEGELHVDMSGNPDVHILETDTLTIDEARRVKALSSQHAVGSSPKIFILSFHSATREAQNALLKLFEEPTARTHFFVVVEHAHILLPTLLSRLHHVSLQDSPSEVSEHALTFLGASPSERLLIVKEMVAMKNKQQALALVRDIERALYTKISIGDMSHSDRELLREIGVLEQYLQDRSASVKLILEHIALRL